VLLIDKNISARMSALRLPLVIAVVLIHGAESSINFKNGMVGAVENSVVFDFLRNLISEGVARSAVPAFFFMSGYFYFYRFNCLIGDYIKNSRSRIRTLLAPYIFWNFAVFFLFFLLQSVGFMAVFFSGRNVPILNWRLLDYLNALLGFDGMPIAYPLWFLRDLIVLCLVAPLIYVLIRSLRAVFFGAISIVWFLELWPLSIPSADAVTFFAFGAYVSLNKKNVFYFDRFAREVVVTYIALLVADVLLLDSEWRIHIHKMAVGLGVVVALVLTDLKENDRVRVFLLRGAPASFFVFCAHEPLLSGTRKIFYLLLEPSSPALVFFLYISLTILVVTVLVVLHRVLLTRFPSVLFWVTGGR
jgi:hypothetical protein